MTEVTDRGESTLSTAVFLHLPSSCPNTNSVLPTQEASAAGCSTEALLCFFAVEKDQTKGEITKAKPSVGLHQFLPN